MTSVKEAAAATILGSRKRELEHDDGDIFLQCVLGRHACSDPEIAGVTADKTPTLNCPLTQPVETTNLYHHEVEPLRKHLLLRYFRLLIVKAVATHNEYVRFDLRRPSDTTIPSDKCDLCVQGASGRKQVQKLWLDSHTTPTKISSSARGAFYLGTMAPQGNKSEFDGHIHSLRRIFRYIRRY